MRASGRERRPNAADTAAPPATQAASTRLAAPCPLPSRSRCWSVAPSDVAHCVSRIISNASKRGEPLREGRLWRSRRKSGSRGEESLGRRRSRAGYPLADV